MAAQLMDDPNRECLGLEPAWVEGTGGSEEPTPKATKGKAKKTDEPEPDDDGGDEGK